MFLMIMLFSLILFIVTALMIISLLISNKTSFNREKASPFECGFDSNSSTRLPFSLRFFLVTIIFLIFDVEIVLLLPSIKALTTSMLSYWWFTTFFFLTILIMGLFHEWNQGALKWSN